MWRYAQMFIVALSLVLLFAQLFVRSGEVGFVEGIVVWLISWWIILFMVLPLRVKGQFETGEIVPGSEPGAPSVPLLKYKAWLTTVLASGFWLIFFAVMELGLIDIDALPFMDQLGPQW
jgi:predicted secreted protein